MVSSNFPFTTDMKVTNSQSVESISLSVALAVSGVSSAVSIWKMRQMNRNLNWKVVIFSHYTCSRAMVFKSSSVNESSSAAFWRSASLLICHCKSFLVVEGFRPESESKALVMGAHTLKGQVFGSSFLLTRLPMGGYSLICLGGQINDPSSGKNPNPSLLSPTPQSQSRTLEGLFEVTQRPSKALNNGGYFCFQRLIWCRQASGAFVKKGPSTPFKTNYHKPWLYDLVFLAPKMPHPSTQIATSLVHWPVRSADLVTLDFPPGPDAASMTLSRLALRGQVWSQNLRETRFLPLETRFFWHFAQI